MFLIGHLAVDVEYQSIGLGSSCLTIAIKYAYVANKQIPVFAVVVEVLNDVALGFYEKFGFRILLQQQQTLRPRLFLPFREAKRRFINRPSILHPFRETVHLINLDDLTHTHWPKSFRQTRCEPTRSPPFATMLLTRDVVIISLENTLLDKVRNDTTNYRYADFETIFRQSRMDL